MMNDESASFEPGEELLDPPLLHNVKNIFFKNAQFTSVEHI